MYYMCCLCKCSRQDAILHRFPCDDKRLDMWLMCIGRDDLKKLTRKQLANLFVCQKHFEKKFVSTKSHLSAISYPTLFTEVEMSCGIPSQENAENVNPQTDHNYARKLHIDHTYAKAWRREPFKEIIATDQEPGTSQCPSTSSGSEIIVAGQELGTSQCPSTSYDSDITASGQHKMLISTASQNPSTSSGSGLKTHSPKRKRLVRNVKDLTPECQLMYNEYKKSKRQTSFYKRAKKALKFNKEKAFEKLTKHLNPYGKQILLMQINLCTKEKKGRRFSMEEKMISLSIMKQSPKCYRFLQKIFILPSKSTLNKMISKMNVQAGICPQVFAVIKKDVSSWNEKKKMCSIIFDELALETALTYEKHKDTINGFEELNKKSNKFADHALVFMLRSAVYKWQQPVCFYFCQGATAGIELQTIIKNIISAVLDSGLKPVALICDQGTAFRSALNSLRQQTRREQLLLNKEPDGTINIHGCELSVIYDPSHLLKAMRNNFLVKNIMFDNKIAKWSDIVEVYKTDCEHTETRLLHKLNDTHVIPDKIKKMKVKNCVKVFSETVSAAMLYTAKFSHYVDGTPVSTTLQNTAEIILFFDKLFDSMNGTAVVNVRKHKGKTLRTKVTPTSPHHEFWKEAIIKIEKIKFLDKNGQLKSVPSIVNFVTTIKSLMRLWQILKEKGVNIMRPRFFNSDPIENFFGQVRAYNFRNNDPNCHSFKCTFKSLLITRVIKFHQESFNCEDDPADQVINLKTLFNTSSENTEPDDSRPQKIDSILEQARRERINVHSRAYTAGWVVRSILKNNNLNCNTCTQCLTTTEPTEIHKWVRQREYNKTKNRLSYPSEGAVRCFGVVVNQANKYLEKNPHENNISANILDDIHSKYSFDFINCATHNKIVLNQFIGITIKFAIINWCNRINKILKGTDIIRLENKILPAMQKEALRKYKTKLKNKKLNK